MKKIMIVLSFFAMILISCGGSTNQKMGEDQVIEVSPDKLIIKLDPVCQMSLDQHPISDTMTYKGKLYGFCSSGCKEAFASDPENFLTQLPK